MKKIIISLALPFIRKTLKDNESKIVEEINKRINVPKLTEEEEKKLFTAIMDSVLEILG